MSRVLVAALVLSVVLAGCGAQDTPVEQPDVGAGGEVTDDGGGEVTDEFDTEQARADARALVGTPESELDGSVRVGRRGDEQMMLTEDYVLGRMTVELDERDGEFRVTAVTVELPDGPETFRS
jgi:hypothetical protein